MGEGIKVYVGLDVHKDTIAIAAAQAGERAPGRQVGTIAHDMTKLAKALARLGKAEQVHVVYEAGPTGYGLQRKLSSLGYPCEVIAPSMVPKRAGERIKTDRRDAQRLAELSRACELRAIWIPDEADEAIRDLSRAREDAIKARVQMRNQLKGFLLRHDVRYTLGKTSWTKTFHRWLATLSFGHESSQIAFTEYVLAVQAADDRVQRLTDSLSRAIIGWRLEPLVRALQALRGIELIAAVGIVAEIGDFSRFDHPRKLMAYLGLVPSEQSSGDKVRKGSITKAGNAHVRRLLTEAAWNYRFNPRIGREALIRQEGLPESIKAIAWKAQIRLSRRYRALNLRGVHHNKVCVAVARELAGFIWAIAQQTFNPAAAAH